MITLDPSAAQEGPERIEIFLILDLITGQKELVSLICRSVIMT